MDVIIKAYLQKPDGSLEVRRIPLSIENPGEMDGLFAQMVAKIATTFPALEGKTFELTWKDTDGDFILMTTDEELQEAIGAVSDQTLRIFIQVSDGEEETEEAPETETETQQQDDSFEPPRTGMAFWKRSFGPGGRGGPGMGRGGCRGGPSQAGKFQFAHCGPMAGGPFSAMKGGSFQAQHGALNGCPFQTNGSRGRCGPFGAHRGMAQGRPFGCKGRMGGPRHPGMAKGCPFGSAQPGLGFGGGPHFGMRNFMMGGQDEGAPASFAMFGMMGARKGEAMKALRESVPVSHRRWAKGYIQQWRQEHVENATTTSSDDDSNTKITMEQAGVPESYALWLNVVLPRMHQRWAQEKPGKFEDGFEEIKNAVPEDFRKWCRWYLRRNFQPKMSPQFKAGPQHGEFMCPRKQMGAMREQVQNAVPVEHRVWTKAFIKEWCQENVADQSGLAESSSESDEETQAMKTGSKEVTIPADYPRWLTKVLNRMSSRMGVELLNPAPKNEKEDMKEFKDTVPMEYRRWAKFYARKTLMGGKKNFREGRQKFGMMLPQFRRMQQFPMFMMGNLHGMTDTSDSDAYVTEPCTAEKQQAPSQTESTTQAQAETSSNVDSGEQQDIPPHVLAWMNKRMSKEQIRRMKEDFKEQKRAARQAFREHKQATKDNFRAEKKMAKAENKAFQFRYV